MSATRLPDCATGWHARCQHPDRCGCSCHTGQVTRTHLADCPFCKIIEGEAPAEHVANWGAAIGIVPLNPVTPGHVLVIPKAHVTDVADDPNVTAATMRCAALWVREHCADANVITSRGPAATQTVFHLHVHVVPRVANDGLHLPWSPRG